MQRLAPTFHVRAKNYTHVHAKKAVDYYASVLQEQYQNAILVNGSKCLYFQKILHGTTCSCTVQKVGSNLGEVETLFPSSNTTDTDVDYIVPLFGSPKEEQQDDVLDINLNSTLDKNGTDLFIPSLFGNAIDCGICYRTGYVPAYNTLGHLRYVYDIHNVQKIEGYKIESTLPSSFIRVDDQGFVLFSIEVPPRFNSMSYRVFNNRELLTTVLDIPVSIPGTTDFAVTCPVFTHVVVMFDLSGPVLIDFPQDQRSMDLTLFDSIGTVQLVATNQIPNVSSGDIVYNIELDRVLKVTDYTYFRLKNGKPLGWSFSARPVQKDETLYNLFRMLR